MSMRAIVHTAPHVLEMQTVPRPEPALGEVRIRTACVGICATDLEMIAGWERTRPPSIPGHEWSGTVDAVGPEVEEGWVGQRVVAENVRRDGGEVGFEHPGAYGEYFLTDADKLLVLPDALPFEAAVLIEPLAVCLRGLRRLRVQTDSPSLIMGDGPIGLLMLLLLRGYGVHDVALVGGRDERLAIARELGADPVIDHRNGALLSQAGPRLQLVEATGNPAALATAMKLAAPGARLLVLGDYADAKADFTWNTLLHQELELIGSNASAGAWPEAVRLATAHREQLLRLVSACLSAERFDEGIRQMRRGTPGFVKIVLDWR